MGLKDVRAGLPWANAPSPRGAIEEDARRFQIYTNDQANRAADYRPLVIAYRDGSPVRLTDVGEVRDSAENLRNQGLSNAKPAGLGVFYKPPGANATQTVQPTNTLSPHPPPSLPIPLTPPL